MMNHNFSLLCNRTSVDVNTKSLSIFDVLEQIIVYADPKETARIPMHFEILSHWMRSDLDVPAIGIARVFLKDPKGITKKKLEFNIELTDSNFLRSIIRVSGIELRGPGKYCFIIELQQPDKKWKKITSIPFIVEYEQPPKVESQKTSDSF